MQESIHDVFVDKLKTAIEQQLVLGDGFTEGVSQGPLINKSQYKYDLNPILILFICVYFQQGLLYGGVCYQLRSKTSDWRRP